jgi:hypothetical protein
MAYGYFDDNGFLVKLAVTNEEATNLRKFYKNEKNISDSDVTGLEEGTKIAKLINGSVIISNYTFTANTVYDSEEVDNLGRKIGNILSGPAFTNQQNFIDEKNHYINLISNFLQNNSNTNWSSFKTTLENLEIPNSNNFPMVTNLVKYVRNTGNTAYSILRLW